MVWVRDLANHLRMPGRQWTILLIVAGFRFFSEWDGRDQPDSAPMGMTCRVAGRRRPRRSARPRRGVDRYVTVILNGNKVIDNQPLLGCTGGGLWPDLVTGQSNCRSRPHHGL
jgi:hypothetical protein